ncbi:uncharacterized protein A4U43_C08F1480 [Asparagus officinalis]|nr:uncharacterized protein A4U43_C08F1480 [Asparagus officinalis]
MSIPCLTCQASPDMSPINLYCNGLNRSCSMGAQSRPPQHNLERRGSTKAKRNVKKKGHRKVFSIDSHPMTLNDKETKAELAMKDEPKLVRSGGMRRDWSFEDLPSRAIVA